MKISEAMKVIDEGWVRKPAGFRVHYQRTTDPGWVTEYAPGLDEDPMDSDVVAWRLAWKFSQVRTGDDRESRDFVNIYVVDDLGRPVTYYATNQMEILNSLEVERDDPQAGRD